MRKIIFVSLIVLFSCKEYSSTEIIVDDYFKETDHITLTDYRFNKINNPTNEIKNLEYNFKIEWDRTYRINWQGLKIQQLMKEGCPDTANTTLTIINSGFYEKLIIKDVGNFKYTYYDCDNNGRIDFLIANEHVCEGRTDYYYITAAE